MLFFTASEGRSPDARKNSIASASNSTFGSVTCTFADKEEEAEEEEEEEAPYASNPPRDDVDFLLSPMTSPSIGRTLISASASEREKELTIKRCNDAVSPIANFASTFGRILAAVIAALVNPIEDVARQTTSRRSHCESDEMSDERLECGRFVDALRR
jgi:hypothetical protein